jgi:5-methylthioadenosine/S-adenosylhomocysteine deaminase
MGQRSAVLIRGGTVVPMDERGRVVRADVLIEDGEIRTVADRAAAPHRCLLLDATGGFVLPGFVQTHVHVVQSLARHRAEGLTLLDWLRTRIWPYEAALSAGEVAAAARLGIAELLAGGTTSALDMGTTHNQDAVFAAAAELGARLTSGKCLMDQGDGAPQALVEDRDEALASTEALGTRWHGAAGGRLRYAVAPRFVLSCSGALMEGAVSMARRHAWMLHTHASENAAETELVRHLTGMGNVAFLAEQGLRGKDTVVAHCVHLDDLEFSLLARDGTGVAHCPGTNLKLASGIADLPRLLSSGARVGLGADGPPCNNRLSIFHEMALAGTIHNLRHGAGAVDAWTVLELATWRGAEVLGLDGVIGRLRPGMRGDVVVLDHTWAMEPAGDPATVIVFGGGVRAVRHVLVDGNLVIRDGRLVAAEEAAIRADARKAAAAVASRLEWG